LGTITFFELEKSILPSIEKGQAPLIELYGNAKWQPFSLYMYIRLNSLEEKRNISVPREFTASALGGH
jgi:hypothetical protein